MGTVNKPYGDIANGTTSDANVVDQQLNTLYTLVNGNIDDNNVKAGTISKGVANEGVLPTQTKGIPYATDIFNAPFIFSGGVPTKDSTTLNQINVPAYSAYATQPDGTLRRITTTATTKQVTTPSSTYYLDLNPDATFTWGGHSTQANYLTICTVTSDASGNVATITDTRQTQVNILGGAIGYKTFGDINNMYAMRNLLDPSKQSFTRASNATRKDLTPVPFNVLRTEQGRFGQGAFIEESTQQLVNNSDFETVTGTATVFSDAMTAGTTADPAWTTQSGSFTWSTSGATSGANTSIISAGNSAWKPLTGSNGTALPLTVQATFTMPAVVPTGSAFVLDLRVDSANVYRITSNGSVLILAKYTPGYASLASVAQTISANTTYTATLAITPSGGLTAKLYSGVGTGGTLLQTLTATDTSLTGGFLIGCGGDTGVVIKNAQVTAPFADGWTISGDQRVAWALTSTNPISGSYSVSAVGVSGVTGYVSTNSLTLSASTTYTLSGFISTTSVGSGNAHINLNSGTQSPTPAVTGTTTTQRYTVTQTTPSTLGSQNVALTLNDAGTAIFDAIQLEQKAYATTYVRNDSTSASATRNADSLSYTLSNPLPSRWFKAFVFRPAYASSALPNRDFMIARVNSLSGSLRYKVLWRQSDGKIHFIKSPDGTTLNDNVSSAITFNVNDSVYVFVLDDPTTAGNTQLWVGVNNATLTLTTLTNTTSITDAQVEYVGCDSTTGNELDASIDFPIVTDIIPTADQVQALYQASDWGGMRHYPNLLTADQQAWIAPVLQNGWINYGGNFEPVGFYKDNLGIVRLRGFIKSGTITNGTTLFNLPVGYRPAYTFETTGATYSTGFGNYELAVTGTGAVQVGAGTQNTWLSLGNVTFRAEQ